MSKVADARVGKGEDRAHIEGEEHCEEPDQGQHRGPGQRLLPIVVAGVGAQQFLRIV